jgi:hypothetical protein
MAENVCSMGGKMGLLVATETDLWAIIMEFVSTPVLLGKHKLMS